MPGPPTPVSGCPLKRMEIREGNSARTYDSVRPASIFTLTLEGERSIDEATGTLVLLIHHGLQRLMSIRLAELLKSSPGGRGIFGIDKESLRLYINMSRCNQVVVAEFEERRDFSVAVCMLQKARYYVHDCLGSLLSVTVPVSSLASSQSFEAASSLGPRLSSIAPFGQTPLRSAFDIDTSPNDGSFSSLLNSPLSDSDLAYSSMPVQSLPSLSQNNQRMLSLPTYPSSPSPFLSSIPTDLHLDPYSLSGVNATNPYSPRVSSPLKISSRPGDPMRHTSLEPIVAHSTTTSRALSDSTPSISQKAPGQSAERSFRELMPQPRCLPFDSKLKKSQQPKPTFPRTPSCPNKSQQKGSGNLRSEPAGLHGSDTTTPSPLGTSNVKSQTEVHAEVPSVASSPGLPLTAEPSLREVSGVESPFVFVTDQNSLKEINRLTERLFEQYTADVALGGDEAASAMFYTNQLHAARRDFWYAKLLEMEIPKLQTSF